MIFDTKKLQVASLCEVAKFLGFYPTNAKDLSKGFKGDHITDSKACKHVSFADVVRLHNSVEPLAFTLKHERFSPRVYARQSYKYTHKLVDKVKLQVDHAEEDNIQLQDSYVRLTPKGKAMVDDEYKFKGLYYIQSI